MKIVHIITSPRAEGTPRIVLDLLDTHAGEQHVIFLSPTPADLLKDFESKDCAISFLSGNKTGFGRITHLRRGIYEICKGKDFDIAICWNTGLSQWVHLGTKKAGIKTILTHAGNPPYGGFIQRYLYTLITYWFHVALGGRIVVPSKYIQNVFLSIPFISKHTIVVIPNCAKVERFITKKRSVNNGKVIMVGTLENHKDHETLLKAWKIVESLRADASLSIAGDGTLKGKLLEVSEGLRLQRVTFLGSRNDVPALLWDSDVFAFCTTSGEGFGTVLLEALGAGLKVVATDVAACRETLVDGKYGKLVAGGSPELMAQAIMEELDRTLTNSELQSQVDYARHFSPMTMIKGYLSIR